MAAALDAMADQVSALVEVPGADPDHDLAVLTEVLARQNGLSGAPTDEATLEDVVLHGVCTRRRASRWRCARRGSSSRGASACRCAA